MVLGQGLAGRQQAQAYQEQTNAKFQEVQLSNKKDIKQLEESIMGKFEELRLMSAQKAEPNVAPIGTIDVPEYFKGADMTIHHRRESTTNSSSRRLSYSFPTTIVSDGSTVALTSQSTSLAPSSKATTTAPPLSQREINDLRATVREKDIELRRKNEELDRYHKEKLLLEKKHEKEKRFLARGDGKIRQDDIDEAAPCRMKTRSRTNAAMDVHFDQVAAGARQGRRNRANGIGG